MDEYIDQYMEDHINGGYGCVLDQLNAEEADEYPDFDEPWDETLASKSWRTSSKRTNTSATSVATRTGNPTGGHRPYR